jgi:hypothetical protein
MNRLGVRAVLVAIGCVALAGALVVGVSDNPPGVVLLYGAIICLILAAVCRWRRPKSFLLLFAISGVGFFAFAILHNLFYAIGVSTTVTWMQALMEALHVGAFLISVLLCPAGFVVGLVGSVATFIRSRRQSEPTTE